MVYLLLLQQVNISGLNKKPGKIDLCVLQCLHFMLSRQDVWSINMKLMIMK